MDSCPSADQIAELVEGALEVDDASGVHRHVRSCSSCRAVLVGLGAAIAVDDESLLPTEHTIKSRLAGDSSPLDLSSPASLIKPGVSVGRFRIERLLGRGGMGSVWAAEDPELGREVAIKVLFIGVGSDSDQSLSRKRLLREAKAMARLSHPNVVPVFEIGQLQGRLFLVMELVTGQTLALWLKQQRSLAEVLDKFIGAGQGLAAAHAAGVIHRDFKPENVLVGTDGRSRVTDFGLARAQFSPDGDTPLSDDALRASITPMGLTPMGALLGTPAYMSPEQMHGKRADARSDLFAFCTALYEALVGVRPFAAKNLLEMRTRIEANALQWPSGNRVPRWLKQVVAKGLRADPLQRQSSMEELLRELRRERPKKSRAWLRPALGAALLLVLAIGGARFLRSQKTLAPQPSRSMAILAPRNASAKELDAGWIGPALAELFNGALEEEPLLKLTPPADVVLGLADLGLRDAAPLASDLPRLRKRMSAGLLLAGKYKLANDGTVTCELELWDAQGNLTLLSDKDDQAHLIELGARLSLELRHALGLGPQSSSPPPAIPANLDAARHYANGLELFRRFHASAAAEELRKAAAIAPADARIQMVLADALSSLHQDAPAREAAQRAFELKDSLSPEDSVHASLVYFRTTGDLPHAIDLARARYLAEPTDLRRGLELSNELTDAARWKEVLEHDRALEKLPEPDGSDERIYNAESVACVYTLDFKCGVSLGERAYALAKDRGAKKEMASALNHQGLALRRMGEIDRAIPIIEEAMQLFTEVDATSGAAASEATLAAIVADRGDLLQARQMFERGLATYVKIGDRRAEGQLLQNLAMINERSRDLPAALDYARRASRLNLELSQTSAAANAMTTMGSIKIDMGDLPGALEVLTRACEMRRQAKSQLLVGCLFALSDALLLQANFPGVHQAVDEALTLEGGQEKLNVARIHVMVARLSLAEKNFALASSESEIAAAIYKEIANADDEAIGEAMLARAKLGLGKVALARAAADRAMAIIKSSTSLTARHPVSIADALVRAAEQPDDLTEPLGILNAVVGEAEHTGALGEAWQARFFIAEVEARRGQRGARERLLSFAHAAKKSGYLLYAQEAELEARARR